MTKQEVKYCEEALKSISELEENWNFYGAKPFKSEFLSQVEKIFLRLNYKPDKILPTGRESIQLEYYRYSNSSREIYLEFEIYENKFGVLKVIGNDYIQAIEFTRSLDIYSHNDLIWLCDIINILVEVTFEKDKKFCDVKGQF